MSTEFVGAIILELDGRQIEAHSLDATIRTGRKLVKTMNRTGRPAGHSKGVEEIELKLSVPIPVNGSDEPDWLRVADAKITQYPLDGAGKKVSYLNCFVTEAGEKYTVDDTAMRDLSLFTLRRVEG